MKLSDEELISSEEYKNLLPFRFYEVSKEYVNFFSPWDLLLDSIKQTQLRDISR